MMKWFGIWRPIAWSSEWKINLYWTYTLIVVFALTCNILSKMVYVVKYLEDPDEIANSLFINLTDACAVYKITNILNRRRDIIVFTDSLVNGLGRPNSPDEVGIQKDFDRSNRSVHFYQSQVHLKIDVVNYFSE